MGLERFIINDGDMHGPKDNIACKTCKFRIKKFEDGYKRASCEKYDRSSGNRKPSKILYENQKCEFYKEDK